MGERIVNWGQEAAFSGVKEIKPGEAKEEIKFESPEEIEKKSTELENKVVELGRQLELAKSPEERNDIAVRVLNLVAGRSGEAFFEAKRQQANT